jgi:undecaprenyl diphosphate synthase
MTQETHLPRHIGIIMDGNGRWAKKCGNIRTFGHKYGTENVKPAISYCTKKGIQVLTLYTFSTENWKRPQAEVDTLMSLITEYLLKETAEMKANGVVLHFIGDLSRLPQKALDTIAWAARETSGNAGLKVNIALNYGGRAEICLAAKNIAQDLLARKINGEDINEALFASYLYTADDPEPDLIIRTGGEKRLSNFLTWQSAYSELYFSDVLWPDFKGPGV